MKDKDKATQQGNTILIIAAMVIGVVIGLMFAQTGGQQKRAMSSPLQGKMAEVMTLVQEEYVDKVNTDSISEHLVAVLLGELDPHSTYLSAIQTEKADEQMRGNFEGVGLVLHRGKDTSFVGQVMADGPSYGSGIIPGDAILSVDGNTMIGQPSDSVVSHLRGPRGTKVDITILRNNIPHTFTINRGIIAHRSIPYYDMLDDTTGYIMLASFTATSHKEFRSALEVLKSKGMRHLIFDLRGNNGGSLSAATGIAGELLPLGSPIVYMKGEHSRRRDFHAHANGAFTKGRITVLIDENSASASEIVSGALQDNDRALVVGRQSFGKGLVQTEFTLKDGSSVLLTTARYYTPSGRCIQRSYDNGTDEYYRSYMQQLLEDTYADTAVASVRDSTPYYTVSGRVVYGGGGIIPDTIFSYHKDTSFIYYNQLTAAGILNATAFDYIRRHAPQLMTRYRNADSFCKHFKVDDTLLKDLVHRGEKAGIEFNAHSLNAQRTLIKTVIKAYIGQSLYGDEVFYRIYRQIDEDLMKIKAL